MQPRTLLIVSVVSIVFIYALTVLYGPNGQVKMSSSSSSPPAAAAVQNARQLRQVNEDIIRHLGDHQQQQQQQQQQQSQQHHTSSPPSVKERTTLEDMNDIDEDLLMQLRNKNPSDIRNMNQQGPGTLFGAADKPVTLFVLPKYGNTYADHSIEKNEAIAAAWQNHLKDKHQYDVTTRIISKDKIALIVPPKHQQDIPKIREALHKLPDVEYTEIQMQFHTLDGATDRL